MIYEVKMPKLDIAIDDAVIVKWCKKEGEKVKKGEPLLEVSAGKVVSEIESDVSGVVSKINFSEDDTVKVGEIVALIEIE